MGGLGDEAPDENVAAPHPAQKIGEATRPHSEAPSSKRLSHRRDQNGRERYIQADEQHLQLFIGTPITAPSRPLRLSRSLAFNTGDTIAGIIPRMKLKIWRGKLRQNMPRSIFVSF
jgi:hypothetical protein